MRLRATLPVLGALLAAATAAGCSGGGTTGSGTGTTGSGAATGPAGAAHAKALLAASLATARKEPSVHFVATSSEPTRSIKIVANAATTAGTQTITIVVTKKAGHVTAMYTGGKIYFKGDTVGLEVYLGMPSSIAPHYAGQWISFTSSDKGFSSIAKSLTMTDAVGQISVDPPLTLGGRATVNGTAAQAVQGTTTTLSSKGHHGSATLWIATHGAPLPVRYQGTGTQATKKEVGQVDFSRWGLAVQPVAPAHAVPASSITLPSAGSSSGSTSGSGG